MSLNNLSNQLTMVDFELAVLDRVIAETQFMLLVHAIIQTLHSKMDGMA
jgi:hypothetical protein